LNFNGLKPASGDAKLGVQREPFLHKSLGVLISKNVGAVPLSLLDCIVVKKYPVYFNEYKQSEHETGKGNKKNERARVVIRCRQTAEKLADKYPSEF